MRSAGLGFRVRSVLVTRRVRPHELARQATERGARGTYVPRMTKSKATQLSYVISDHDAEDVYRFEVEGAGDGGLSVKWTLDGTNDEGGPDLVEPSVLERSDGVFVLSQGNRVGEIGWCPPFVVARSVRAGLASGEVELRTGFEGDAVSVTRAELEDLSSEAKKAAFAYGAPVLAGKGGDGELVVSASEPSQLVWLRANDGCTVAWRSGVLPGKVVKPPAKAAKNGASPLDDLRAGGKAKRIAAAKKLAGITDPAVIEALLVASCDGDPAVTGPIDNAYVASRNAAKQAGTFDLLPVLRARLAAVADCEGPTPYEVPYRVVDKLVGELSVDFDARADVRTVYEAVAWTRKLGHTSGNAASFLVGRGHAPSIERASALLGDPTFDVAAWAAVFRLPPDVGVPRARAAWAAATDEQRRGWASLLTGSRDVDPAYLDVVALTEPYLRASSKRALADWVVDNEVIERGRRDSLAAWALFFAGVRWDERHDALLAMLPDAAFDGRSVTSFVPLAVQFEWNDRVDVAARFPTEALVAAVAATSMVSVVIGKALLARRAKDPSVVSVVTEWAKTAKEQGDYATSDALAEALDSA